MSRVYLVHFAANAPRGFVSTIDPRAPLAQPRPLCRTRGRLDVSRDLTVVTCPACKTRAEAMAATKAAAK